jgi:hypothetical protein
VAAGFVSGSFGGPIGMGAGALLGGAGGALLGVVEGLNGSAGKNDTYAKAIGDSGTEAGKAAAASVGGFTAKAGAIKGLLGAMSAAQPKMPSPDDERSLRSVVGDVVEAVSGTRDAKNASDDAAGNRRGHATGAL